MKEDQMEIGYLNNGLSFLLEEISHVISLLLSFFYDYFHYLKSKRLDERLSLKT